MARLLHRRGWQVASCLPGDLVRLPPDARSNHDRWTRRGRSTRTGPKARRF
nr:hypothetical protein [Thioclava pacifica]